MSVPEAEFPEYGSQGDHLGARRSRRAFRLCVWACVFFTVMLWLTEYFLRHEQSEYLYLSALKLPAESARPLLRMAVKVDAETHKTPTPKYLEALAEREEDDLILPTYEKAYRLDPANASLAVRYGCRLFLEGRPKEALERFREAGVNAPGNALPMYLAAAVMPWAEPSQSDLGESLALIARTNTGDREVVLPKPLWFAGLTQSGKQYAELRRRIADECCAPLYQYAEHVAGQAKRDLERGRIRSWDSWLETLQVMGERIAVASHQGTLQAIAGIHIELAALDARGHIPKAEKAGPAEELGVRRRALESGLKLLRTFEETRPEHVQENEQEHLLSLKLGSMTPWVLLALYVPIYLLSKRDRGGKWGLTLPHPKGVGAVLISFSILVLLGLGVLSIFQNKPGSLTPWMPTVARVWWMGVSAAAAFGAFYPLFTLSHVGHVASAAESKTALGVARRAYRMAYVALLRRYYGTLVGLCAAAECVWVVAFRVWTSLYPWQINLLTTGAGEAEAEAVRSALALLR